MIEHFILDEDGQPVPWATEAVEQLIGWALWMEQSPLCKLRETFVGDIRISTLFLGFTTVVEGKLFETMIFGGRHDLWQRRYKTREEALKGHEEAVALCQTSS
jgi:hypothetical protein